MKKLLALLIPLCIAAGLVFGYTYLSKTQPQRTALQVTATPQAEVFINDTSVGKTPFYNDTVTVGQHTIKLIPQESNLPSYEEKTTLRNGVLTVIDRVFKRTEAESEGSVISLEETGNNKSVEIAVVSTPDGADVKLNDQPQGVTPLLLKDITVSDHQITVSKNGYNSKIVRVRTTEGYRLTTSVKLSIAIGPDQATPATDSGTPTATASATVTILDTPTGFLRVRSEPSVSGDEITRVNPDETYSFVAEEEGWFKIKLKDEKEGWVSSQYAKKTQ